MRVWEPSSGRQIALWQGDSGQLTGLALSPDGLRLATAGEDGTARIRDAVDGSELLTVTGHVSSVRRVAFSPDGTLLATSSRDRTARLWDAASGAEVRVLSGHEGELRGIAFSPDGSRIATASDDATARIWSVVDGAQLHTLQHPGLRVYGVAFLPDGNRLVTCTETGPGRIWEVATGRQVATLPTDCFHLAFDRHGTWMAATTPGVDPRLAIVDLSTLTMRRSLPTSGPASIAVDFSPDGKHVVSGLNGGRIRIWDPFTPDEWLSVRSAVQNVLWLVMNADGTRFAVAGEGASPEVWDANSGELLLTLKGHTAKAPGIAFSPDGSTIATVGNDQTARIWDAVTGRERTVINIGRPGEPSGHVSFMPDGRRVVVATGHTAQLVDIASGRIERTFSGHDGEIITLAVDPGGSMLATTSDDKSVRVWSTYTGGQLLTLEGHSDIAQMVTFSHDGTRIATGSNDDSLKVWDATSGELIFTWSRGLSSGYRGVYGVYFSPDDGLIAAVCADGEIRILDSQTAEILDVIVKSRGLPAAGAFSPDGRRLLVASYVDATIEQYSVDFDDLIALARSRLTRTFTPEECRQYLHVEACPDDVPRPLGDEP
jgi:WD40 repeat protein